MYSCWTVKYHQPEAAELNKNSNADCHQVITYNNGYFEAKLWEIIRKEKGALGESDELSWNKEQLGKYDEAFKIPAAYKAYAPVEKPSEK